MLQDFLLILFFLLISRRSLPDLVRLSVSGSLRVVLLVAVQFVRIVRGHLAEILEDVLVGFISWEDQENRRQQKPPENKKEMQLLNI